jgi:PadR family transcriptional regulator PadR
VLLLLSERPSYGYNLEKDLLEFNVGRIDRPTVYRALADLEADGLVSSWSEAPSAGQARRVYGVTPLGERVLRVWMHVIKRERDSLGNVLRRYQATGTIDAVLAEVDGGWAAALGFGWSPVSATSVPPRRFNAVDGDWRHMTPESAMQAVASTDGLRGETLGEQQPDDAGDGCTPAGLAAVAGDVVAVDGPRRFRLTPDRSVVLIDVRSTVGPISFGADRLTGSIAADIAEGASAPAPSPRHTSRSRSTGSVPATGSTTPSFYAGSMPAASRRRRWTCATAWRWARRAVTAWPASSRSTA